MHPQLPIKAILLVIITSTVTCQNEDETSLSQMNDDSLSESHYATVISSVTDGLASAVGNKDDGVTDMADEAETKTDNTLADITTTDAQTSTVDSNLTDEFTEDAVKEMTSTVVNAAESDTEVNDDVSENETSGIENSGTSTQRGLASTTEPSLLSELQHSPLVWNENKPSEDIISTTTGTRRLLDAPGDVSISERVSEEQNDVTVSRVMGQEDEATIRAVSSSGIVDVEKLKVGARTPKISQDEDESLTLFPYHPTQSQEKRPRINASKRDLVRSWLSEPWLRPPAAILVPLGVRSLARALAVWEDISKDGLEICDLLLIGYDNKDINWVSRHEVSKNCSGNSYNSGIQSVTAAFHKLIQKHKNLPSNHNGDAGLDACMQASKLVPYDSALIVITDSRPSDGYQISDAIETLLLKRQKLYTVWTEPNKSKTDSDATAELKKISTYTQGEFIDYSLPIQLENEAYTLDARSKISTKTIKKTSITPLLKSEAIFLHEGYNSNVYTFPVDGSIRTLQVYVEGNPSSVIIYSPNGIQADLTNPKSVADFNDGSRFISYKPTMVELVLPGWERRQAESSSEQQDNLRRMRNVGAWRLAMRCDDKCVYRATVAAMTNVAVEAFLLQSNVLRLRLRGPIGTVSEATLIDEGGTHIVKLPFSHQSSNLGDVAGRDTGIVSDVPLPEMEPAIMYVKIQGKDAQGNTYIRISEPVYKLNHRNRRASSVTFPEDNPNAIETDDMLARQTLINTTLASGDVSTSSVSTSQVALLTAVQIGLSSRLYGAPGDTLQIHFEVTNYRDRNILFSFKATGNLRFLRGIRPTSQWISPGQTANVVVDIGITASAANGAQDLITFTATGLEQVTLSAYVTVLNSATILTDVWIPQLWYNIEGDCIFKTGADCGRYSWTANIFARDRDSGILRISSSPVGFRYSANFIAGSREEMSGTYRSNCCNTRLLLTATDSFSNTNSYVIDVSYYLPPAVIAAIVLAVILFIVIVLLVATLIYICLRRRKESRTFPSYATSSRRENATT